MQKEFNLMNQGLKLQQQMIDFPTVQQPCPITRIYKYIPLHKFHWVLIQIYCVGVCECVRCWRGAGSFGVSSGGDPQETLTRPLKILPLIHFALLMGMCFHSLCMNQQSRKLAMKCIADEHVDTAHRETILKYSFKLCLTSPFCN